jgi:hypothetical protein
MELPSSLVNLADFNCIANNKLISYPKPLSLSKTLLFLTIFNAEMPYKSANLHLN